MKHNEWWYVWQSLGNNLIIKLALSIVKEHYSIADIIVLNIKTSYFVHILKIIITTNLNQSKYK